MEIKTRRVRLLNLQLRKFKFLFLFSCFVSYMYQLYKHVVHKLRNKFINYKIPYDLDGYQCVITGGAGEIGIAVVKKLLRKNCRVLIATIPNAGQTFEELEAQLEKDLKNYKRERWEVNYLDLSSFRSVNEFVDNFKKSNRCIDILINNAAVFLVPFRITADGFERHLQTNYLGHCLLILNLLPVLRPSPTSLRTRKLLNLSMSSKVINLSSSVHRWVTPDLQLLGKAKPEDEESYSIYHAYSYSKLLIIAFNFYLIKNVFPKLNANIRSVQIHPGGVASSMVIRSPINNILPVVKYESLFRNTFLWVGLFDPLICN